MAGRFQGPFAYAALGRSGLGNKLFPYARCLVWSQRAGVAMLPAHFFQLPIGPLLRRERDLRLYSDLFRMPSPLAFARRSLALAALPREKEREDQVFAGSPRARHVYWFEGLGKFYRTLNGHEDLVREHLLALMLPEWRRAIEAASPPTIAVHVRLGDFSGNIRHPIEWYVDALRFVRRVAGWCAPATVFSDAGPDELAPLLAEESTTLAKNANALVDMFHLSRARFLVATGSSTFGAWAAYFGQMPALTRPGNPFSWWHLENRDGHFIGEADFDAPDPKLVADIERALGDPRVARVAV